MWRISAASWTAANGKTAAPPPARSRRWSRATSNCRRTARCRRKLGNRIISALTANPRFISAAIPLQIFPPLFNRYAASDGHHFGIHVDNAVRGDRLTGLRIRTDLSVTLFLSEPDEYDGGELVVEDLYGSHEIKLPAGDLVLYPASSLHHGHAGHTRYACGVFFLAAEHGTGCPRPQPDLRSRLARFRPWWSDLGGMTLKRSN